ncbi:MAG TPA: N-acetylmuramoyl-L-alanine amidase [bacterium]|nr:N-acetylmuramoyl-L-alanine amidase [bacterium]HNS48373.1 N-acetylmuramoyl-L-alanine amidase [bacterium]
MRRLFFLSLFLFLILVPQLEAALNVAIESPLDDSCFRVDTAVLVNVRYTCDQAGYSLIFKVDGIQKSSVNASQGVDIQQVFVWDANAAGVFTLTVELRKTGCYSASASIEATVFSVGLSGKTLLAKGKSTSLTATPTPGGLNGTYSWSVTQGSDKINLEGSGNTISVNGLNVSGLINDVVVKVEFTASGASAAASATHSLTVFDVEISEGGPNPPDPYIPVGGKRTYLAIVAPPSLDQAGPYTWSKSPSETEVISLYPVEYSCEVRADTYQTGSATLKARFDPGEEAYAEDSLGIFVFRPNIVVGEIGEGVETDTGAYLAKGGTKSCLLQLEGTLPPDETVTLTCDKTGKVSLWDGETPKSFPYQCAVSALPKNLTIKGEATSDTIRDITLTLTTARGGSDIAKITVFEIKLDWYDLSGEAKYDTGLYVPLNVDDDNNDTSLDKNQPNVFQENDLKKLIIRKPSPSSLSGFIALTISSGTGRIKLWENSETDTKKITEVSSENYDIAGDLQADTWLWVEGYDTSSIREVEIKLSYTAPDETIEEDKVKATVKIGTVLLDPGHGGTDSGAVGPTGLLEKEPNLNLASKLKTRLQNAGVEVNMTRSTDETVSLSERNRQTKEEYKPSFFFSIHNNAWENPVVRGTETFTTSVSYYELEDIFANQIQSKIHGVVLENDRGVKRYNYQVLRHSENGKTDGNLSETTFITNAISEDRLREDDFKEAVAEAMKKAILKVLVENISYPKQPNP